MAVAVVSMAIFLNTVDVFLALTAAVVTASTISPQGAVATSVPEVAAYLHGLHMGLLVIVAAAALGMLIATAFIQKQSATRL